MAPSHKPDREHRHLVHLALLHPASNKRKMQAREAATERAQKLEKRRDSVEGKKDMKKKAKQMY